MLSEKDKELLEQIRSLDHSTLKTGKDERGASYLTGVFRLHKLLFNEACSICPGKFDGYITRLKNYNTMKKETTTNKGDFELKDGVMIPVPGTSKAFSRHNLTDVDALEILAKNPARIALFSKFPDNYERLVADAAKESKANVEDFDIEKNIAALKTAGVETKATTVDGVRARIGKLSADERKLFDKAMAGEINLDGKTLEQLQFDADKAQQDFDDLGDDATPEQRSAAQEAVNLAQNALASAK